MLLDTKNRIFYIFLILNAIIWTCIESLRNVLSIDAMEAISWGELIDFGTNKHPPLSGWLASSFYHLGGNNDVMIYLLGQICILIGFIFIYKLAKYFVSEEKAICSALILESCFYYTYDVFIDNFNCNIISMAIWPVVVYYFYKSTKENRIFDWVILGFTAGLGFLGKYQIILLFCALFIYLLLANREKFRQKGLYIACFTAVITVLPHLIWLFKNDFFSLFYLTHRTVADSDASTASLILARMFYPVKFFADQLLAFAPCIGVYLLASIQPRNIGFNKQIFNKDSLFLICIAFIPIVLQGLMGTITGSRIPGIWGTIMVSFFGIVLFYFFPVNFNQNTFKHFMKWIFASLIISVGVVFTFWTIQTQLIISYPYKLIMKDFNKKWELVTDKPLKYVGGDIKYIFQFRQYNNQHPRVILETFGHENIWINQQDVKKSGAIIFGDTPEDVVRYAHELIKLLPENYDCDVAGYNIYFCNKLTKCEGYSFYYTIIPPEN